MCSKAFCTSKVGLGYIENSAISLTKKTDNLRTRLCLGHSAFHNSVSLTRIQLPFLTLVCYIRLVYRISNFQIVAIALTSLVKDTSVCNFQSMKSPVKLNSLLLYHLVVISAD